MDTLRGYHQKIGLLLLDRATELTIRTADKMTELIFSGEALEGRLGESWFRCLDCLFKVRMLILAGIEVGNLQLAKHLCIGPLEEEFDRLYLKIRGAGVIDLEEVPSLLDRLKIEYDDALDQIFEQEEIDKECVAESLRDVALSQLISLWAQGTPESNSKEIKWMPYVVASKAQFLLLLSRRYRTQPLEASSFVSNIANKALSSMKIEFRSLWKDREFADINDFRAQGRGIMVLDFADKIEELLNQALQEKASLN